MALESLLTQRFEDVLSGRIKAYQLPEFQSFRELLEKAGATSRAGTARQLRQRGISGPAVGMTLQKQEESQLAPIGAAVGTTMGAMPGQAAQYGTAQRGLDIQKELGLGQLYEAKKSRELAEKIARAQSISGSMQSTDPCVLTTACYGENSGQVEFMRAYRDDVIPEKILRGYYIFSDVLLPLMKFKVVKEIIRHGLVDSLVGAGLRRAGFKLKTWRMPSDTAIAWTALVFWKILGSRGPYRRRNGEVY